MSNAKNNVFTFFKTNGAHPTATWYPCRNDRQLFRIEIRKVTKINGVSISDGYVLSHYEAEICGHTRSFNSLTEAKAEVIRHLEYIYA